jgi:hypothetical protein
VSADVNGECKLGRIQLTKDNNFNCYKSNRQDALYCKYDRVYADGNDASKHGFANCNNNSAEPKVCPRNANWRDAACYFRDEVTRVNTSEAVYYKTNTSDKSGAKLVGVPNVFASAEDTTAAFDLHRYDVLKDFTNSDYGKDNFGKENWFETLSNLKLSMDNNPDGDNYENARYSSFQAYLESGKFGDIVDGTETDSIKLFESCKLLSGMKDINGESDKAVGYNSIEKLVAYQAYIAGLDTVPGALSGVKISIDNAIDASGKIVMDTDKIKNILSPEKKKFFQRAVGRGLLIGAGVGTVAGVGYWFAEGASTFCDIGGLEQVKLNKTYSIPSFRNYLMDKGFIR